MKVLHRYKLPLAVLGVLSLAAFFRLYRIADYMTFLGDEGRDVLVAKGILEGNLVFLGPRASAGDFFLGPIYYYMMAPFLWLFNYNPVGPAVMVALIGVATVYLVYHVGKEFFGVKAGLFASILYAVSPLVIRFSHSSWNPNPVPFFTLLLLYSLYKAVKLHDWRYYLAVGILFGILIQLHYIIVFLGVIIAFYIVTAHMLVSTEQSRTKRLYDIGLGAGAAFLGFIAGFSPFLAFEIKNSFPNFRTIITFITGNTVGQETTGAPFFVIVSDVFTRVFGRLLLVYPATDKLQAADPLQLYVWQIAIILLAVGSLLALIRSKDRLMKLLFFFWVVVGIILFGFYKKPIYDYYFGFLFPAPFLLVGNLLSTLFDYKHFYTAGKVTIIALFALLLGINLWSNPFREVPNRQLAQMRSISEFILSKTGGKPFNFALITGSNSDHAYRYFFQIEGNDPVVIQNPMIDPKRTTVTDQLLVLCETVPCSPLGHPLFEIASFGRGETSNEWGLEVGAGEVHEVPNTQSPFVKVYKLKHYTGKD
jgi:4-amino-4-deoxy-L-arabinose transferase-like glycosyltransferase